MAWICKHSEPTGDCAECEREESARLRADVVMWEKAANKWRANWDTEHATNTAQAERIAQLEKALKNALINERQDACCLSVVPAAAS
jgi:hypothetical protein